MILNHNTEAILIPSIHRWIVGAFVNRSHLLNKICINTKLNAAADDSAQVSIQLYRVSPESYAEVYVIYQTISSAVHLDEYLKRLLSLSYSVALLVSAM